MKAKYGIKEHEIYSFDETGFQIGIIYIITVFMGPHSSEMPITDGLTQVAEVAMNWVAILEVGIRDLSKALEEANKRRQRRKGHLHEGGSLTVEEVQRQIAEASIEGKVAEESREEGGGPTQVK